MSISGFSVDLGGTKTASARIENNIVLARLQRRTDPDADLATQIDAMAGQLEELGYQHDTPLGVAVAGRVDSAGNWHAVNTGTLRTIKAAPLQPMLRDRFGPHVRAVNDAAAAAYAEAKLGAGRGADNFAYLTVSTGVGGGLVIGGKLIESRNGIAGHVGFVSSRLGKRLCGSGRMGTVESIAGGRAMAEAAGVIDGRAVFADPALEAYIDASAAAVAALIADLTAVLGLDRVALGGSIGLADGYRDRVLGHLMKEPPLFQPPIIPATLGHDSGLIGALLMASHSV